MKKVLAFVLAIYSFSLTCRAVDLPGGMLRTAENLPPTTYEMLISPSYIFSTKGAYLTSELRYQPVEAFAVGGSFGAGVPGFNVGANAVWYPFAHSNIEPELSLLGGLYFNRVDSNDYFLIRLAPTISKTYFSGWGEVIPYASVQLTPSFRMDKAETQASLKAALGTQLSLRVLEGLRFTTELGFGLVHSQYNLAVALSYPFLVL
jgi:hypothetical protein